MKPWFQNGFLAVIIFYVAAFRLTSSYREETKALREEIEKLDSNMTEHRSQMAIYGPEWAKEVEKSELELKETLPDEQDSAGVLEFFVTDFEKTSQGRAVFTSVTNQTPVHVEYKIGDSVKPARVRVARYKLKAEMEPELVVPYLQHLQEYPSLFRINTFVFSVKGKGNLLDMDLGLEFYLSPAEWVADKQKVIEEKESPIRPWRQVFVSSGRRPAGTTGKLPTITRIVGGNVIINENLYEEGDVVNGWKIHSISGTKKTVILRSGSITKEVPVP